MKNLLMLMFALAISGFVISTSLMAADQVVTSNADAGAGTLRQAIIDVTTGCTITFNLSSGSETITTASQFSISGKDFTIDGDNTAGSGTDIILQANASPWTATHRLFYISTNGTDLTVKNMTIQHANTTADGGAFYLTNTTSLTIENCTVKDNRGQTGGFLKVNNAAATCTIDNCTISGNKAHNTYDNACGGAINMMVGGTITATNSTFYGNESDWKGSGGFLYSRRTIGGTTNLTFTNCTFSGNAGGTLNAYGGAFYVYCGSDNGASTSLSLTNCTVDGNTAQNGAGFYCYTSWNNHSNVMIALVLKNCIVSNGTSNNYVQSEYQAGEIVVTRTYTLCEDATLPDGSINGNIDSTDPLLDALADNGGPTWTQALQSGSDAINAGTDSGAPLTDQRGYSRSGTTDMGAYEYDGFIPDPEPPTVTVDVPNGGEEWNINGEYQIQWTSTDNVGVTSDSVFYSSDNGSNWTFIATHTGNPQNCYWTIPDDPSVLCLIKVIVYDDAGNSDSDISDNTFSIIEPPFQLCESFECDFLPAGWDTTYVVTPGSSGDYISQHQTTSQYYGVPHTGYNCVRFGSMDTHNADSWLFTPRVSIQAVDSLIYWISSYSETMYPETYQIWKCSSQDPAGADDMLFQETVSWRPMQRRAINLSAYASTDVYLAFRYISDWKIYLYLDDVSLYSTFDTTPPTVTVNVPNGGEEWMVGNTYQIQWTSGDDLGVCCDSVLYSTDNGSTWSLVAIHSCNPQSCYWTIPDEISDQCLIKVFVQDNTGNSAYDISDNVFSIVEFQNQQFVNCNFETGDLTGWATSTLYSPSVTTHEGSYCCYMHVGNTGNSASGNPESDDGWIWAKQTLAVPADTDTLYFDLEVEDLYGSGINGHGSVWIRESDDTWTKIFDSGGGNVAWANHQVNISAWAGETVTFYLAAGSDHGWFTEMSKIYFDNVHLGVPPSVTVTVPNGGEEWIVGNSYQIQWTTAECQTTQLDSVFYSFDNGSNWIFIESHTDNPQYCDWIIPNTPSEECLVKVVVYDNGNNSAEDVSDAVFTIGGGIINQLGFPIHLGGSAPSECSPQVADIDGDGDLEVLMGGNTSLYIYHHDGTSVTGFPVTVGGGVHHANYTAAVADIDNDDVVDIIVAGQRSNLYVYNNDGTLKTGWPQSLGDDDGAACSPAVADLDGDDDLEIVIGTWKDLNGNNGGIEARVYVFHHDGTPFAGWPVYDVDCYAVNSTPAIGDIDNDGDLEIIVCGRDDSEIWAWHTDGTVVSGFPVNVGGLCESSPTLADIDDDDDLEIFVATGSGVYGYHHDGTAITGWPQSMSSGNERSSASIGDMDGDGDLEIVCGGPNGSVYVWHHTGVLVSGWPQVTGGNFAQGTPAIGDIDGDGDMEIVEGTYTGVYAWHHDGTMLPYYPLYTAWSRSSPTITDLDQDGDIDMLIGSLDGNLYAWDLTGTYNADNIEWGSFRNNLLNTGLYITPGTIHVSVDLTVLFEGPFNGTEMNTDLNPDFIPLSQPYNIAPWNYTGTESIVSEPNANIVDWVLIELRDTTEAQYASGSTKIARQAAFVLNDGSIVGLDGTSILTFNVTIEDNMFVVIWHRNHLGVMSAYPLTETSGIYTYDFTTGADKAYGGANGHKEIGTGIWGMRGGDGNSNGDINNLDKNDIWLPDYGNTGYLNGDFNMDSQVLDDDKIDLWEPNSGKGTQVL